MAISAITLAELAADPHAIDERAERTCRQERLHLTEAAFDATAFDADCARAYGRVYAETLDAGRKARGKRAIDLLVAATARASDLPIYTANAADFAGLDQPHHRRLGPYQGTRPRGLMPRARRRPRRVS